MAPPLVSLLSSLPSYIGTKRTLAPLIFRGIDAAGYHPGKGHVLIDPFMGGGSVSLLGKALGFRVIANDVSPRSQAIGAALIVNSHAQLHFEDVATALDAGPGNYYRPPFKRLPFSDDIRDALIALVAHAETFESPAKRALMRTLAVKAVIRVSMWGQIKSEGNKRVAEKRYDKLTRAQSVWLKTQVRPIKQIIGESRLVNTGVFSNGHQNEMHLGDVLDFLRGVEGDVVYLDPPYPGTVAYEDEYVGIDELLLGRAIEPVKSRFSANDGWKFLGDVFDAAEHIPCWVLSLGNASIDIDTLSQMMRERGREVDATSVKYAHLVGQSSPEKREANEEYLIVAWKRS